MQDLTIIGRAERIDFADVNSKNVPAKIDTGADRSSVWASDVHETDGHLEFCLFGKASEYYTGHVLRLPKSAYKMTVVENSFGEREQRYVVRLRVLVNGRLIRGSFSLADRSTKTYPVLLGRRLLHGKFLVDVTAGEPLVAEERQKTEERQKEVSA